MSNVTELREQLAEQLANACAETLRKHGFHIQHGGPTWERLYDLIKTGITLP